MTDHRGSANSTSYEKDPLASKLLLTERGELWLQNFPAEHRPRARKLVSHLTLVSLTEFERKLAERIDALASKWDGTVALFTVREVPPGSAVFDSAGLAISPVPAGRDIGSEGRIASFIRNLSKQSKFLNNPTLEEMKAQQCDAVFFIDDFIGSGERVRKYLEAFYRHPTIRSWFSYKEFEAVVVAYAAIDGGVRRVQRSKMAPTVSFIRSCPTLKFTARDDDEYLSLRSLCKEFSDKHKLGLPYGFGQDIALLVFEHGCPNNCPSILWRQGRNGDWAPLFPDRAIGTHERGVFPSEIVRNEPVYALVAAGAQRLAQSSRLIVSKPLPAEWITLLLLCARGVRRIDALEAATKMSYAESARTIEDCVSAGLLTQRWRLTEYGRAELDGMLNMKNSLKTLPKIANEYYYPKSLRDHSSS